MRTNFQRYEATVKFTFEAEVFPEDPDDVYELAELETATVENTILSVFDEAEVESIKVEPVIEVLAQ